MNELKPSSSLTTTTTPTTPITSSSPSTSSPNSTQPLVSILQRPVRFGRRRGIAKSTLCPPSSLLQSSNERRHSSKCNDHDNFSNSSDNNNSDVARSKNGNDESSLTPTTLSSTSTTTTTTTYLTDCKLNNLNQSNPSTPTIGSGTISKGSARKTKPMETFNPQDFYSIDLSQLIYQEDPPENMVIVDGQIEHASLNKLIEELTSHVNYDIHFLHTFMLTFRNFTDKETIFKKLEERFNYPPNCPPEEFATFKREVLDKIRLRIINCIKYWIENFFVFDFDNEMMQILNRFIEMVKKSNQNALASVLEKAIDRVKNNDSGKVITQVKCPEVLKLKKGLFNKKKEYNILDYPLLEVARQICLIDYAMFKTIEPKECLNQAWNKEHRVTKAPNISKMIQYFNLLSGYVATEVLRPELELEKRVKTVEKFLELANHCKSLNNFNAVFSIMSGLNSSAVHRLSKVWDAISEESKKIREDLEYLRQGNNFSNLRNVLKNVNPPCVPFNGLFLTDLTFIEDGAPKYINGLINFGKCRLFAKVIRDIQTYQNTRYNFEEYPELKELLLGISKLSDDELFNLSLQIEPRKQKKKKATGASSTAGASASLTKDDDDDDKQKPAMDL
ncbi:hypothetical protein FDP41_001940 [Naegleria fowleri]|uniref:Ras-GEF domain-containing protein n=1 Tax=Naegleria fowleri TaxID=5763 RepID=A0A6A5BZ73_NAEFO|nr:uncharacterized protein FDP41_001940 [Naegleria fowleri]KAF0978870.1 hypothetical protein FDP41_001940 [Naegleria fowleri]CAG4711015.1 unnamed protein product [Naegleria fowleri]